MAISQSALNRGRRATEADMLDACTVEIANGTVWDAAAMADVPAWEAIYEGRCEVKYSDQVVHTPSGSVVEGYVVKVPISAPALAFGTRITVKGSARDPLLPGRVFFVSKLAAGSHAMARRYQVKETSGPGG